MLFDNPQSKQTKSIWETAHNFLDLQYDAEFSQMAGVYDFDNINQDTFTLARHDGQKFERRNI